MVTATRISDAVHDDDLDVDGLLTIPEIRDAVNRYLDIQHEYRDAILREIRDAPDGELPDVEVLSSDYRARLRRQRVAVRGDYGAAPVLIEALIVGVLSSLIGGAIGGVVGWFLAIRKAQESHTRQIELHTRQIRRLMLALADILPDAQAAQAFRSIMREEEE